MGADFDTPNRQEPARLNTGITVIGKRATIPAGVRLGRNVKVLEGVRPADFGGRRTIASGGTVDAAPRSRRTRASGHASEAVTAQRMTAAGGGTR